MCFDCGAFCCVGPCLRGCVGYLVEEIYGLLFVSTASSLVLCSSFAAFAKDINHYQFIPYIQLHEFEALIFTDLEELYKDFPENDQYKKDINRLLMECNRYSSPELINQGVTHENET